MSQPKRYAAKAEFIKDCTLKRAGQIVPLVPVEDKDGTWVSWDDYAALAAENERLRQHLEFFRGKFDAKSNKLFARILKDTKKFAAKEGGRK